MQPLHKAVSACALFTLVGAYSLSQAETVVLPLVLYYIVLVVNTFVSVRTFSAITPKSAMQTCLDIALVLVYIALAFSFNSVFFFSIISALLFALAVGKYVHMRAGTEHPKLLRRKIRINALGVLLSLSCFAIAQFVSALLAAWALFAFFAAANVFVLYINPLYRLDR